MKIRLKAEEVIKLNQEIIDGAAARRDWYIESNLHVFHNKMMYASDLFKKKWKTRLFYKNLLTQEITKEDCLKFLRKEVYDYESLFSFVIEDQSGYSRNTFSSWAIPNRCRQNFMDDLRRLVTEVEKCKSNIESCQLSIDKGDGYIELDV